MAKTYETFRLPDKKLLEALAAITKAIAAKTSKLTVRLDEQHRQAINCPLEEVEGNAEIQQIIKLNASLMGDVSLAIGAPPYNGCSIMVRRSGVTDSVTINLRNDLPVPPACQLVASIQDQLKPYERDESFDKLLGDELAEFYRKREEGLVRLEALAQRIVEQNEEYRRKLDQEAQATQTRLHEQHEALSKQLQTTYERKDKTLHEREHSLEKRLKEIDDDPFLNCQHQNTNRSKHYFHAALAHSVWSTCL